MSNELLRKLLIDEEGCELKSYQVEGIWHIGIGHNLEVDQTDEELDILGEYDDPSKLSLTEDEVYTLFDLDVEDAIQDLYPAFTDADLDRLTESRRAVIISMAFQLGGGGIRKFKNFIAAVKAEDFDTAADEMLYANVATKRQSLWYRQTPDRCQRAANAMRTGRFLKYEKDPVTEISKSIRLSDLQGYTNAELIAELQRRLEEKETHP